MRSVTIDIVGSIFASEIYLVLDAVVSGQVGLREESGAEGAATLFPFIANKLGVVTGSNTTIENGNSYSVSSSTVGNATADLGRGIFRKSFAGSRRDLDVAGVVGRVGN